MLGCDSRTITRVCRSSTAAETRSLGLQVDSMQFYADLLNEILGESAPYPKSLHLKQNATKWPKMIHRERWTPATKGADIGDCHLSRMAGQLRRCDTLDRGRKHDYERSDERSQRVKAALGSGTLERRMECTTRRHVDSREVSVSIKTYTKDEFNAYKLWRITRRTE